MAWKILSIISAICLAGAAYFAFISKEDINIERRSKEKAEQQLKTIKDREVKAAEGLKTKTDQLASLEKDLAKLKTDVEAAKAEAQEKAAALELAKKNLDQVTQQVAEIQKKIDEMGDPDKLIAQVNAMTKDKDAASQAVANAEQELAQVKEALTKLQGNVESSRETEARGRRGELDPTFTATIAQPFTDWGFAVLSKGNAGGVVANADLEVKRGKTVVAKLKVRNVEQTISVADIIPGSVAEGDTIRRGDTVVPAPAPPKKETPPPTAPAKAPGAPATPPAAPAPGAMGADPFGAPAAAPKPAAPGADPFGAPAPAPAPATPPAGAPADPFGAPPATPPAAGGAGTKASPSTADPFK